MSRCSTRSARPVILLTHSQGGGIGFNVADERPNLIAGMVAIEPGGPQIGIVGYRQGGVHARQSEFLGPHADAHEVRSAVRQSRPISRFIWSRPNGPATRSAATCRTQPVHKLVGYQNMRILSISAEGTYHRVFDVCIPKWLNQAGAKDDFVRLEDVGIHGNMHEMFLDRNSDQVIKFIDGWLDKNVK